MKQTSPFRSFPMLRSSRCLLLLPALLLASCATPVSREIKPDPCAGWSPIYVSKSDILTDGTAKAVLSHDLHGVNVGCWGQPTKAKKP